MILCELTCAVIHTTGLHQSNCCLDSLRLNNSLASGWVNAIVSKHSAEARHALNINKHGALDKIPVETIIGKFLCCFKIFFLGIATLRKHGRAESVISAAGKGFFLVKRKIDVCTASIASLLVEVLEVLNSLPLIDKKSADHNGSSVNHGVVRSVLGIKHWSIEHHTAWLLSDPLMHLFAIALVHIDVVQIGICDNLADRLHRELAMMITELSELAIS